jgi:lysophospholipase L1-like esterase
MLHRHLLAPLLAIPLLLASDARADGARSSAKTAVKVEERPAGQIYQVAAIGDSLTDVRSHGGKYLAYLRDRCPESRFDNYGKGGESVEMMRRRFVRDVIGHARSPKPAYTHVIVFGGVNDVLGDTMHGRTPKKIENDMDTMYGLAREAGIKVVGITVSPWGGYAQFYNPRRAAATREVNQWILAQWRLGKIDYAIDAYELLSCGDAEKLCADFEMRWIRDGLHFNQDAHARLGQSLHETVFSDCR